MPDCEEPARADPFVVVFYYHGRRLHARIRNVASQELWILRDAQALHELLSGGRGFSESELRPHAGSETV